MAMSSVVFFGITKDDVLLPLLLRLLRLDYDAKRAPGDLFCYLDRNVKVIWH